MDQAAELNLGDDIWFDHEGVFVETLKFNYENGPYAAWVGKFNPNYGIAWDYGRGIWGEDFAEDYEITEKLGIGASYTAEKKGYGKHTVEVNSFFNDTTFLSNSTITSRGRSRLEDGGAGNTEDLGSFVVSANGENLGGVENLTYHVAYRFLAEQDSNPDPTLTDNEAGYLAGFGYVMPVNKNLQLDTLFEYTRINNFEGVKDVDVDYYYANIIAKIYEKWNITAGYTFRDINASGLTEDFEDHLFQLSGGYDFGNGFTAEAGYRQSEEANVDTGIIGFLLRYSGEF